MEEITVFITTATKADAEKIGTFLVETKLAACANILPGVTSVFSWQGKTCIEEETLMILKSRKVLFARLSEAVKKMHSYSNPEIIALPILDGSDDYLQWLRENTLAS